MHIVKTWCENTKEGMEYLKFNGYKPVTRLTKDLWLVRNIDSTLDDVTIIL